MSKTSPADWKQVKLGDVTGLKIGGTPSRNIPSYWSGGRKNGFPWVSIADLRTKFITETSEYITQEGAKNSNVKLIAPNTILMSFKLTIGRTAVAGTPLYTNEAICAFDPLSSALNRTFLYQGLQFWNLMSESDVAVKGVTLNKEKLANIPFSLPPLPEQSKIAEILSTVDQVIELTEKEISRLEDLKKGMMNDLFTKGIGHTKFKDSPIGKIPESWEVTTLEAISDKIGDGLHSTPQYTDASNIYFINGNNLCDGKIVVDASTKKVSEDEYFKHKKELNSNTILLSINGTIGNLAFYNAERVVLGKSAAFINLKEKCDKFFVFNFLSTGQVSKYFDRELTGTTISNLSLRSIRGTPVVLPSQDEQSAITKALFSIENLIRMKVQVLNVRKAIKKALMNDLLTGKVRVKV